MTLFCRSNSISRSISFSLDQSQGRHCNPQHTHIRPLDRRLDDVEKQSKIFGAIDRLFPRRIPLERKDADIEFI